MLRHYTLYAELNWFYWEVVIRLKHTCCHNYSSLKVSSFLKLNHFYFPQISFNWFYSSCFLLVFRFQTPQRVRLLPTECVNNLNKPKWFIVRILKRSLREVKGVLLNLVYSRNIFSLEKRNLLSKCKEYMLTFSNHNCIFSRLLFAVKIWFNIAVPAGHWLSKLIVDIKLNIRRWWKLHIIINVSLNDIHSISSQILIFFFTNVSKFLFFLCLLCRII